MAANYFNMANYLHQGIPVTVGGFYNTNCFVFQLAMAPASAGSDFSSQVKTVLLGLTFVAFASSRILLTKLSSNDSELFLLLSVF